MNPSHNTSLARILRCSHPPLWLILAGSLLFGAPCAAQTCDYTVISLADSGDGTLRTGVADANAPNICFGLKGTITLSSALQVTRPVTITATGVTISGGLKSGIMVINTSSPTDVVRINGLTLTGGNASEGGAVYVQQGNVTFVGTTIDKNTAALAGAIFNSGTLSLSQCAVTNNTAIDYYGGGIYNASGASLSLTGTTVSGNSAGTQNGGGLDNLGTAQISGGTFSSNRASQGAAIFNEQGGQLQIQQGTTFSNNSATEDGGAIYNSYYGTTTITMALFNGNQAGTPGAASCGGAICNEGTATITESTFTANSNTGNGGAIQTRFYSSFTLDDDTISGNTASLLGGGLDTSQNYAMPSISNTIVAGNTSIYGKSPDCNGCANPTGSTNLIGVTVNLGPLANNGGPTLTMMPLPGSSAIAAGIATGTADNTDQRGFSRFNASGGLDIGAVQTHYSSVGFVAQPSNTLVTQPLSPAVAVQVVETDGTTTNYPLGVPVTLSLINAQTNPTTGTLAGTLTEYPTSQGGVIEAVFADLSVDTPGSYQLSATDAISGNSSSADPAYNATSNAFQISLPPVVTLNWQPAPFPYGPMPQSELNAVATINGAPATGTFVYTFIATGATINVGQIYPVGVYPVVVEFTPTGSISRYKDTTSLQILQATPVLTWPTPAPIYISTPLSATQLDATATGVTGAALAGTFVYKPAAGTTLTAGSDTLSATFTPTDTTDYTSANVQVTIQINAVTAATVTIQDSANPITFGQGETFAATVTGTDGQPFSGGTANFTVDGAGIGSAPVTNGSASVSDASLTAGTHAVGVSYTNAGTNQTLTATTTLVVNKATPKLTWPTPAAIFTSTPLSATQLDATATGVTGAALAGTFAYSPAAGATLPAGPQTLSTTFTPSDTTDYTTNTAQVIIQVNAPTAATVVIQESANPVTFGQSETFTAVVTGTDGKPLSGGTAAFTVDGAAIGSVPVTNGAAAVNDSSLTGGTHAVAVLYTNTATSQTLTAATTLTVNKATPKLTWPTPTAIYTSTPLSATQLDATATGVTGSTLAGTFAYNPTAGTTLNAGSHILSTTFTPTDSTDYTTNTAQVTIQVNAPTAASATIQESANPITFGQSVTFTATVSGSDGQPFSGGTAAFTSDGTAIGSATVVNGAASVTASSLTGGTHQVAVSYTNSALAQPLTGSATLIVNKAAPIIAWPTPAPIYTVTPLSSTQLNAASTGVNRVSLPGTFVYSPAAGATLPAGAQTLSATFTPTDATDYTTASAHVTIQVGYATIAIASVSPGTASVSASPLSITVAGSGFTSTSELEVNGTPIATTVQSSTAITAAIPGADLAKAGTLSISVYDPASKFSSNVVQLTVTAPTANVTFSIPQTTDSGEQPAINIDLNSPYPTDLQGTLALTFAPAGNSGVDDPAIRFSTGGRTLNFAIPAGSTTAPQVALQTGTVAGTITVTLTLNAGGVDVTPPGLAPITLVIAPGAPVITSVTFSNDSQGQLTVVVSGFSNTRDMNQAEFVFTGTGAKGLRAAKIDVSVPGMFSTWYGLSDSDQYGSEFTYTQNFQLSKPDQGITGVAVTLTNSVGTSGSVDSQ